MLPQKPTLLDLKCLLSFHHLYIFFILIIILIFIRKIVYERTWPGIISGIDSKLLLRLIYNWFASFKIKFGLIYCSRLQLIKSTVLCGNDRVLSDKATVFWVFIFILITFWTLLLGYRVKTACKTFEDGKHLFDWHTRQWMQLLNIVFSFLNLYN